jgi:hypothetical protein
MSSVVELTCDADDLVRRLVVSMNHPALQAAAAKIVAVTRLKHMGLVRTTVSEFVALAEHLAGDTIRKDRSPLVPPPFSAVGISR